MSTAQSPAGRPYGPVQMGLANRGIEPTRADVAISTFPQAGRSDSPVKPASEVAHQPGQQPAWERTDKFDPRAAALADRHYNRRKIGSPQFMPPGQTIVLLADVTALDAGALWGWWRPDPASGLQAMNGLDGWTCTIFRNERAGLSSSLILEAELAWTAYGYDIGPDGMLTYVWDSKVASANPGYCFKMAGWTVRGRSADKRKTLLWKRAEMAGQI